jgi:hypothetical protein
VRRPCCVLLRLHRSAGLACRLLYPAWVRWSRLSSPPEWSDVRGRPPGRRSLWHRGCTWQYHAATASTSGLNREVWGDIGALTSCERPAMSSFACVVRTNRRLPVSPSLARALLLLLWTSESEAGAPGFVDEQHSARQEVCRQPSRDSIGTGRGCSTNWWHSPRSACSVRGSSPVGAGAGPAAELLGRDRSRPRRDVTFGGRPFVMATNDESNHRVL